MLAKQERHRGCCAWPFSRRVVVKSVDSLWKRTFSIP